MAQISDWLLGNFGCRAVVGGWRSDVNEISNIPTRALLAALIFAASAGGASAQAQEAKSTTIKVKLVLSVERITQPAWTGYQTHNITVILSGRSDIRETYEISAGIYTNNKEVRGILGKNYWRVIGANRLERRYDEGQNIDILTVTVDGSNCNVSWETQLKPGFTVYKFKRADTGEIALFSAIELYSGACNIEQE